MPLFASRKLLYSLEISCYLGEIPRLGSNRIFLLPEMCYFSGFVLKRATLNPKYAQIARSYIILRPLPHGARLGDGPIGDAGNNRMLALPKKVLPVSPKDRFMTFVEKSNISMDDIKSQLSSSDYTTKTVGVRHTPAAGPIGEGIYAITQTGRETHLAYILTIPSELSEVQEGVGLRQRGSYITSAKNPQSSGPANANLPQGAEYPQEYILLRRSTKA